MLHQREFARTDQPGRRRGQRAVQRNDIGACEQLIERYALLEGRLCSICCARRARSDRCWRPRALGHNDLHAECASTGFGDGFTEHAVADDAEGAAAQFADRVNEAREVRAFRPGAIDGIARVLRQFLRQAEHYAEHVLHHRGGAVVGDIADGDPVIARSTEIHVVRAGCGQHYELELMRTGDHLARYLQFVEHDDLAAGDHRSDLILRRHLEQA